MSDKYKKYIKRIRRDEEVILDVLRRFHRESELEDFLRAVPDEMIPKVLDASYEDNDNEIFITVFNHIVNNRAEELWIDLARDNVLMYGTFLRFNELDIWTSVLKFMRVGLPTIVQNYNADDLIGAVRSLLETLYAMPDGKILVSEYGHILKNLLVDAGKNPTTIFERALAYSWHKDKILEFVNDPKWDILRRKVSRQPKSIFQYAWDALCFKTGLSDEELKQLRGIARDNDISDTDKLSKVELCRALVNVKDNFKLDSCNLDDVDPWTQDEMSEIPSFRRYKIGNNCFDVYSLRQAINMGIGVNPYDRSVLPVKDIKKRIELLDKIMIKKDPFYDEIRNNPILSRQSVLTQLLATLWGKMTYPVPITAFLQAPISQLDGAFKTMSDFAVLQIRSSDSLKFSEASTKEEKMNALVEVMQRIMALPPDEYSSTRIQAIELALNDNIIVPESSNRRRAREDDENDQEPASQRQRLVGGRKRVYARR